MAVLTVLGILVTVAVNTALAVVMTRFFRLQLETQWATAIYTLLFVPLGLIVSTIVLSGVLSLGGGVDRSVALLLAIVFPLGVGVAIDLFWLPSPEEVELAASE